MVKPTVSVFQLELLEGVDRGEVRRRAELHPHWQLRTFAVTSSVRALIERGFIEEGAPVLVDGEWWIPAVLTAAGRELLADFSSRGPFAPKVGAR